MTDIRTTLKHAAIALAMLTVVLLASLLTYGYVTGQVGGWRFSLKLLMLVSASIWLVDWWRGTT